MAEDNKIIERTYTIPLRRAWINVPEYKRSRKAIMTIKHFIARHMKVQDRNLDKVKLDVYLNNDLWHRGKASPPSKIKVKAIKEGDIVKVIFFETPEKIKFLKLKHSKLHKKGEDKREEAKTAGTEVKAEDKEAKTEEQKKDESEKGKAVEQLNIKQAEAQVKAVKHTTKAKEQQIHRMALKK